MAIERTLSIIKPDAVAKNVIGQIYARFEAAGLKVVAARMAHLSRGEAEAFYAVHKERPFFKDLVEFMISGPVFVQVLEGLREGEMVVSSANFLIDAGIPDAAIEWVQSILPNKLAFLLALNVFLLTFCEVGCPELRLAFGHVWNIARLLKGVFSRASF